jgi:hypothetical protein
VLTHEKNEPQARPDAPTLTPERARRERWWTVLFVGLLVLPLVVSAFYLWFAIGDKYLPPVDWAIFELQTRDALNHGVFVGPYSRFGFNHPGPLMFYVLAVPYKLLGSRSISMHIAALGVNAVTIATIGWVAFRRGRLPIVITVMVPLALLTRSLGADVLRNPWNPYLPLLPLFLLLLLAWSVAVGDRWMLPIAIAVASFAIQSHVGLALESLALLVVAGVGLIVQVVRTPGEQRRKWWRGMAKVGAVSAGVFLVLWLPVAYGTIVQDDGNLGKLFDFFTQGKKTAGLKTGLEVLGLQWGPRPEWIIGARGSAVLGNTFVEPRWWAVIWLVLGAGATAVAVRRRSTDRSAREVLWLAGLIVVGLGAALLAVSNIIEIVYPYLTKWTWILGAAMGMLVLQGVWLAIPLPRRSSVLRVAAPLAAVLLAVIGTIETVEAIDAGTPFERLEAQEHSITRQVLEHLPAGKGPVLINTSQGGTVAPGIVLALERHGIPVEMIPSLPVVYGPRRSDRGGPYRARIVIVSGDETIKKFVPPGPRIAHYTRPLGSQDREAIRAILAEANRAPPGPNRDALLALVRDAREGPAVEIAVYLDTTQR